MTYLSIPAILCTIVFFTQELTNLYFISDFGDSALIASMGLSNMIQNCVVIGTGASFNQALETLVSQTIGLDNLELCGTYLNRGIFVWTITFAILCSLLMQTEWLLIKCN